MESVRIGNFPGPYIPAFELNTERYCISPYSVRMREEKYGPEKLRIWTLFTQCTSPEYILRDYPFNTYATISEKITFFTHRYGCTLECIKGQEMLAFRKNFWENVWSQQPCRFRGNFFNLRICYFNKNNECLLISYLYFISVDISVVFQVWTAPRIY